MVMRNVIVKAANKSVFSICLLTACVLYFSSCDREDDGGGDGDDIGLPTSIFSNVNTITGAFSVEFNVEYSASGFKKLVQDYSVPSEFGVLVCIDGTPSIDNYKYKLSTWQLNPDSTTFTVKKNNIQSNTTYNYIPYIKSGVNYYYGDSAQFSTNNPDINMLVSVGSTSLFWAKVKYDCSGSDCASINNYGVAYSENRNYVSSSDSLDYAKCLRLNSSTKNDSIKFINLSSNTIYYVVSYSKVGSECFISEVKEFTTKEVVASSDAVDLGLSVRWASCNLGATKPEEFGDYYAWGETSTKSDYTPSTCIYNNISFSTLQSQGVIDANGNLTSAYDVARKNLGGTWRIPTSSELSELCNDCDWKKYTLNEVVGYLVIGPNDNFIFLPVAGVRYSNTPVRDIGNYGFYWGSTTTFIDYEYSSALSLTLKDVEIYSMYNHHARYFGHSIRPVKE